MRAERYYSFYGLSENEKLEAAVVSMDGDALRWYQWENKQHPIRLWADLKLFILRQFRPTHTGSLYEQWLATEQTTTVAEYRRKFIEMAAPLDGIPETILMGKFVNGLKEELKAEIRVLNPMSLDQAMEMAGRVEERNRIYGPKRPSASFVRPRTPFSFNKGPIGTNNTYRVQPNSTGI